MAGTEAHHATGSLATAISNLVVQLTSEHTGRGPTRARTHIHPDLVTVVLTDTLTRGERTLVAHGHTQRVLDTRKAFQLTMRSELVAGIEALTGRVVLAFMSDNSIDPDMAIEAFVLAPTE